MHVLICIFCKKYIIFPPFSHIFYLTNPDRIRAGAIADGKTHLKLCRSASRKFREAVILLPEESCGMERLILLFFVKVA